MIIYGLALLAFCYVVGQLAGEYLGVILGVDANVGGVGFAMILLIVLSDWLSKKEALKIDTEQGIQFWSKMYVPIIVAMSATQNAKAASVGGLLAILAGIIPVVGCALLIPVLTKLLTKEKK